MTTTLSAGARGLTQRDARTLALSAFGGALEFYDFVVFVFFVTTIGTLFFPPEAPDWLIQLQAFGIFAAGYLARPLGGIVMAHFGDLFGRKRMFTLSIFLMALSTLGIGLAPTYETIGVAAPILLLVLRILQGSAIGGEVPGAWVFVSEHVPARRVGLACGTLTGGLTFGILLGSLAAGAVERAFTPEEVLAWGWRLPFLAGGVFGLIAVYLRQWLEETPVFEEMRARKALAAEVPLKAVLRDHRAAIVVSLLLTWFLSAAIVVVILMTPTFLQKLHGFDAATALAANAYATVALSIGCVAAGALADRFGGPRCLVLGAVALAATTLLLYARGASDPALLVPFYTLAGLAVAVVAVVPKVLVEAFPPAVRFTGLSFGYNLGYAVFGGLTPLVVSLMLQLDPGAPAHYVALVSVIGAATAAFLAVRQRAAAAA